ncbi:chelatase [Calocera viscosa TUFC12733]|uniref:Chelatase n=1 Tax=Calocera viscosa (strain TUFC12733) TaxID=1330018 RepID=A0A167FYA8_CALVF|nr:chelatase [Calocera viscosa TUFC12733]
MAPHKARAAFRYAWPYTKDCLDELGRAGVKRAVAFTQYPQYSCSTTGSSLNVMWPWAMGFRRSKTGEGEGKVELKGVECESSTGGSRTLAYTQSDSTQAFSRNIEAALAALPHYDPSVRSSVVALFSAHSPCPSYTGSHPYVLEVSSTVSPVIGRLGNESRYRSGLGRLGEKKVCLVPIAFISDYIETLFELDHKYAKEAKLLGTNIACAESFNGSPVFARADPAAAHLKEIKGMGRYASVQMGL